MNTLSRRMSHALRHDPVRYDIRLDLGGWVRIDTLARAMNVLPGEIVAAANTNDKKRFTIKDGLIRACQGHSFSVDLGYAPERPPLVLYHGTHEKAIESIKRSGLTSQTRQHVHLSDNVDTATRVGQRHGKLVVLKVWASDMEASGFKFYRADNGVWLTEHVPRMFLEFPA